MSVLTGYPVKTWLPSSAPAIGLQSEQRALASLFRDFERYAVVLTRKNMPAELLATAKQKLKVLEDELIPAHERLAFNTADQLAWSVFGVKLGSPVRLTTGPLKQWPVRLLGLTVQADGSLNVLAEDLEFHRPLSLRFAANEQFIAEKA